MTLCNWPSDTDITSIIKYLHKLPFIIIEELNLEVSTEVKLSSELESNSDEFFEIDREISDVIHQASKHTTNTIDNIFNFSNIENKNIDKKLS
ncbi:21_t:CDS:2 [Funneliformis caledonium]|uniref:21_t:CDS:1 n=1 Tax=Funneliformis caledonium TaxID=1117310 RepID=A0A9N9HE98_9GLOM|nr:21_t:CDS:2 [Funneliformis caledonium]